MCPSRRAWPMPRSSIGRTILVTSPLMPAPSLTVHRNKNSSEKKIKTKVPTCSYLQHSDLGCMLSMTHEDFFSFFLFFNPYNAETTVAQSTRMQRFSKTILLCWYSLDSSR